MRPVVTPLIALFLAWLFSCSTHATGVYKWVDARGNVHYGDKPSAGTVKEIDIKTQGSGTPPPNEAERRERQRRLLNVYQEEREAARAKAQKEKTTQSSRTKKL